MVIQTKRNIPPDQGPHKKMCKEREENEKLHNNNFYRGLQVQMKAIEKKKTIKELLSEVTGQIDSLNDIKIEIK